MSEHRNQPGREGSTFAGEIGAKVRRKLHARRSEQAVWFGLGMLGVIGWSVVVPTLIGAAVGLWLDRHHPGGRNWTLALMMAGLGLGCLNAWQWVQRQGVATKPATGGDDV